VSDNQTETAGSPARRTVLLAGAGGAGLVALAACSNGGSSGGSPPRTQKDGRVAELSAVPVGGAIKVDIGGSPAIVARPSAQQVACFSAICTHQGCTVEPSGDKLNCPCHGSQYDAMTGQVLRGPAAEPLPEIGVTVKNGEIVTTGATT
jgi:Rieske Fe-S protein